METQRQSKEVSVEHVGDSVDPPPMLANRTCAKLWATLDRESECAPNSSMFLDSAYFSPETFLSPSFLLGTSEPEIVEPETPKRERNTDDDDEEDEEPRSSGRIGLIASVSVGILIAFFLFPMIELVKRSTRSYVTESWTSKINRQIGHYEQINVNPQNVTPGEEIQPYNLALFGWQELHSEILSDHKPPERVDEHGLFLTEAFDMFSDCWAELTGADAPAPLEAEAFPAYTLLVLPGQEDLIRSAYGQGILIREGRVFVRVLPSAEPAKK